MASNSGAVVDPDYNESADWVEIYNSSDQPVSLNNYFLTDNFSNPTKWQIKTNTSIEANGYQLIWADGLNVGLHASFKLSADGEELALISPYGEIIDSISFKQQEPNISMGRESDGAQNWVFYTESSPGEQNLGNSFTDIVYSSPHFSLNGGIYNHAIEVQIESKFGGEVRYTLNGAEPDENSPLSIEPLNISKTTVVRARIFKQGEKPGNVVTQTYFINSNKEIGSLPVVAISTHPDNFWDSEKGIYVQDYKPEWEIPVNIELFENDGSDRAAFNLRAGVKINALYAWKLPQKMLGVYFRKEYGEGKLDYPLIFEKKRKKYDSFALRASGSDWTYTLFRDGMAQNATYNYTQVDNSGFRACAVYVNGEYMGIHNIREKINDDYVMQNFDIPENDIYMVEYEEYAEEGGEEALAAYNKLIDITKNNLTNAENWLAVENEMDIENFTDLVITELWSGNTSIGHNVMAWRQKSTGKWRWILMDIDRGFFNVDDHLLDFYIKQDAWPLKELAENPEYIHYLGKRTADHLFTTFHPGRIIPLIERHKNSIQDEIPKHVERWEGTTAIDNYGQPLRSYDYWLEEVQDLKDFINTRTSHILDDLTQYGFEKSIPLVVSTYPENAGHIHFNGLKIPIENCTGKYPANENVELKADALPGYRFVGWSQSEKINLVEKKSHWKYNDSGSDLDLSWKDFTYNDENWPEGQAELGYGDGDENTIVSFGNDGNNKHITTYFRKTFTVYDANFQNLILNLKYDDGAVVYLNNEEILRANMPDGIIDFKTTASKGISNESSFKQFSISANYLKNGENLLAVEIHQTEETSSDISFDLELSAIIAETENLISTNPTINITTKEELQITAIFEQTGACIVPSNITSEHILTKECSPYLVQQDVEITSTGKLIIEEDVEIWMPENGTITANGSIVAKGTNGHPVIFKANPQNNGEPWGIINIVGVADTSYFSNVLIEDASSGKHPIRETAAISAYHSIVVIDSTTIENVHGNPIAGRYSDIRLTNSYLHSAITGDLINVKYGKGFIDNCRFTGNNQSDTDAIDYDDVENGIIKNSTIHDFHGSNSDAIDIGEQSQNVLIDSIFVYNITDKGVSVGQQSTATVRNSIFTACNLGAGLKDSSRVTIDHCTYYGNNISIATYEKNPGRAGANVVVQNSILSNSYESTLLCDDNSTLTVRYSLSDNDSLPNEYNNLLANPIFDNPTFYNFGLTNASPAITAASNGMNMGITLPTPGISPKLIIDRIFYSTSEQTDLPEFFSIYNPSNTEIDLTGMKITRGVTFEFPTGTTINAGERAYLTADILHPYWDNKPKNLYQWSSGKLADEGETILLESETGILIDGVKYNNKNPWPILGNSTTGIVLNSYNVDNHFGSNWIIEDISLMVSSTKHFESETALKVYPNPASETIRIEGRKTPTAPIMIYNLTGECVYSQNVTENRCEITISQLPNGLYLVKSGLQSSVFIKH
ncbi:MAG: CotH kinase family protein [Prolixibacteraceae bacterium]|nr:CotH kinase family protein [Prolixibacteraceae bacterium]MBN2648773.1 CotH kinase family protein [Prolixibacteraceae bacterium]